MTRHDTTQTHTTQEGGPLADAVAAFLSARTDGERDTLARSLPGAIVAVHCAAHTDAADRLPRPATVGRADAGATDTVPVSVTFAIGDRQERHTFTIARSHGLYRLTRPSGASGPFDRLTDAQADRARAQERARTDRRNAERLERVAALQSVPASVRTADGSRVRLTGGSRPDTVARVVAGAFDDSASALSVWRACQSVARSVCQSMQLLTQTDAEDVAGDTFRALCERVASVSDGLTFADCLSDGGASLPVWQTARRVAGLANAGRGHIDWQTDWRDAAQADDCTGRNRQAETARQVVWRQAIATVAALCQSDAAVRAFVVSRLSVEPMPTDAIDAADRNGKASNAERRAALLRHRNAGAVPVGRARARVSRGKATRQERAAVAVWDAVADVASAPPAVWPVAFDRLAQERAARVAALPVSRSPWRILSDGRPSASVEVRYRVGDATDRSRQERQTSDVSAALSVLHGSACQSVPASDVSVSAAPAPVRLTLAERLAIGGTVRRRPVSRVSRGTDSPYLPGERLALSRRADALSVAARLSAVWARAAQGERVNV